MPVAVFGTENVRRGWRIRPRKVRVRAGLPMTFPTTGASSPALAEGVTERIWACVSLQWEWLGGERAAERERAAASGEGARGSQAVPSANAGRPDRERISAPTRQQRREKERRAA